MNDRQLRWKEKLEVMDGSRLVKQVHEGGIAGKRPRGQPKKRWSDNFKKVKWTQWYHSLYRTYYFILTMLPTLHLYAVMYI